MTVTIIVNPVNDLPVADDLIIMAWANETLQGTLTGSDIDSTSLSFALTGSPTHGSVEIAPDGTFSYIPEEDYVGEDQFIFMVSDMEGGSSTGTVTITVVYAWRVWLPLIIQ